MYLHTSHWPFSDATVAQRLPLATKWRNDVQTWAQRVDLWARQATCAIRGHDSLLHFDRGRLCLRCANCGHESPGWIIADKPLRS